MFDLYFDRFSCHIQVSSYSLRAASFLLNRKSWMLMRVDLRQTAIEIELDVVNEPAAGSTIMIATSLESVKSHEEFTSLSKIRGQTSLHPPIRSSILTVLLFPFQSIPYEMSRWQDLKDLFRREVGDVSFVELFSDESNKPRGCGIVEFEKPESVAVALEKMNGYALSGRNLVVKEDFGNERDKFGRVIPKNSTGGGNGGGGGNASGSSNNNYRNNRDRDDDRM